MLRIFIKYSTLFLPVCIDHFIESHVSCVPFVILCWGRRHCLLPFSHVRFFATPWPPWPSPTPGVYSNSSPLSRWWHPTISSSVIPFSSCLQTFPASGSFPSESALHIRWPKYWSFGFNISPSNEHPGLISFRMDWLDLLAVQGILKSALTPQFKSINSLALSFLYSPKVTPIHDYWKNHSLDELDLCL